MTIIEENHFINLYLIRLDKCCTVVNTNINKFYMSRHIKKKFMYCNLMIKGYADLFNVNVLCTDACVWLHTLIYMIKRNPQKCRIPLCTKKIMHSLTHEDYWNVHWKKPIQIFKIHVYKHVSFSGFFFGGVLKLHESKIYQECMKPLLHFILRNT